MKNSKCKKHFPNKLPSVQLLQLCFWLWVASAFAIIIIITIFVTAWAVKSTLSAVPQLSEGQTRIVTALIEFPDLVTGAAKEVQAMLSDLPRPLLIIRQSHEQPNWIRRFPKSDDSGYLLLAGVDQMEKQSIVQLIRIADGISVAKWVPDWPTIFEKQIAKKYAPVVSPTVGQANSPLLLPNGDIVFNTSTSLVRLSICSQKPVWVLDKVMHHSIDLDPNGTLWVPSVSQEGLADNPWIRERIRDDALARISMDGKLLEIHSFAQVLLDNGFQALLLGMFGSRLNADPIHMNQIRVATQESKYWNRGDLLISARHLSTVFLYRPSTGKIFWHQTGPWMNQHSADFVDKHRISVFDNNVISIAPKEHAFLTPGETNRVVLYDFDTGQTSQPFATLLAEARPVTITGGVARVLPDGGLFIEETNYGRHLRFTRDQLLWSRVNDYNNKYIGSVSMSRYLTADEAKGPLQAIAVQNCSAERAIGSTITPS
jgi:hypothetical protein